MRNGKRRELTQEQKDARAARRAKARELARIVRAMPEAQRAELAARMSPTTIEGHTLSVHNACMVSMQYPNVSIVGGLQQWRRHGRKVRKGEHGLSIWVPLGKKHDNDGDAGQFGTDEDGEPSRPRFIIGYVFDVSQTDEIGTDQEAEALRAGFHVVEGEQPTA